MKILLAASEVAPIIKLGGLGDVVGSLPKALEKIGVNIDVIVPFFPGAKTANLSIYRQVELEVPFAGESYLVAVYKAKLPNSNVDVLLLKNPAFNIGGKEAFANNLSETEMFSFFDKAVVEYIKSEFNTYDLIHCNDWHTGLITHLLTDELGTERPATLFTIHNLLYQGIGNPLILKDVGINPGEHQLIDWDISDGNVDFMLQGITSSDYVNAVSPNYALEIRSPEFSKDLSDVIITREGRISGILNGIDYTQFPRDFDIHNAPEKKAIAKQELQQRLHLEESSKPLCSFVARLDPNQKGLDILLKVVPEIVKNGGQFVLLGTGDAEWAKKFKSLSELPELKGNISINLAFDLDLANKIYAACDFTLIPSLYEPCGLVQMIAMWYGAIPIVHGVGGLKDSVKHGVTGFVFDAYTSGRFMDAITRAFKLYHSKDKDLMVQNCMREDFSWKKSAEEYKLLYEKVIKLKRESF